MGTLIGAFASAYSGAVAAAAAPADPAVLFAGGVYHWLNDQRAVYSGGSIYAGFTSTAGHCVAGRYRATEKKTQITDMETLTVDDHYNPVALMLHASGTNGGKVLWGYPTNSSTIAVQLGQAAGSIVTGTKTTIEAANASYIHLNQTEDTSYSVWAFYRYLNSGVEANISYKLSTNGAASFGSRVPLISNSTTKRLYCMTRTTSANRIDIICTDGHPGSDASVSLYHMYMTVAADGTFTLSKSDGTAIGSYTAAGALVGAPSGTNIALPVATSNMTTLYGAVANSKQGVWLWDIAKIGTDVSVMFVTFEAVSGVDYGLHRYVRGTLSGGAWTNEEVCNGGDYQTAPTANNVNAGLELTYSGGCCLDPNNANAVYVSRKYAVGDFRLEKWTKSGTWAKSVDVSGNTGTVNFRPHWVDNYPTTQILYLKGTYSASATFSMDVMSYPGLEVTAYTPVVKPATVSWKSAEAPAGTVNYWPFVAANNVTDAAGATNGTIVGAPTFTDSTYGYELSGWSVANYVKMDAASNVFGASFPCWFAVMAKNSTSGVSPVYAYSKGDSAGGNVLVGQIFNSSTSNKTVGFLRDSNNDSGQPFLTDSRASDGGYHVWHVVMWSATDARIYLDGSEVGRATKTAGVGTFTSNELSLGVLRRSGGTASAPFPGSVVAFAQGAGSVVDPFDLAHDWLSGAWSAIRA